MLRGTGSFLPERVMTNDELATLVDTSDEWIRDRTGIRSRHLAGEGDTAVSMGTRAAAAVLERTGHPDIDLLIAATCTSETTVPSTACLIQRDLGLGGFPAFDVNAACSGFAYAMATAEAFLCRGLARRVLLVATEVMSRITDFSDRSTCVLFGDGAAAMLLEAGDGPGQISVPLLGANGADGHLIVVEAKDPASPPTVTMKGRETFRQAVEKMGSVITEVAALKGWTMDQVDLVIPHQANLRIMEAVAQRMHLPAERMVSVIDHMGNTSSASIPLALDEYAARGLIADGAKIICVSFGAGSTWGGVALEWSSACSHS